MKKYLLRAYTLFFSVNIIVLTFLSSCKKEEEQVPAINEVKPACKPIKSYRPNDPSTYWLDQYDNKDNLLTQHYFDKGTEVLVLTYKHNEKGQVIEKSQEHKSDPGSDRPSTISTYTFEYNDKGQVSTYKDRYSVSLCEYDSQGNRIKITETYPNGPETRVLTFEYKNGNCIKAVYPSSAFNTTYEYEYYLDQENKMAPFERVNGYLMGQTPNRNMLKKITITEKSSSGTTVRSTQYAYEYNDKGFPMKSTTHVTNASGSTETILYTNEYLCQ